MPKSDDGLGGNPGITSLEFLSLKGGDRGIVSQTYHLGTDLTPSLCQIKRVEKHFHIISVGCDRNDLIQLTHIGEPDNSQTPGF